MASTTFVDSSTVIVAAWLNDVNTAVYAPTPPSTTLLGDVTGSGTSPITTILKTVNSNVGTFGTTSKVSQITVNNKGLVTAVSEVPINALTVPAGAYAMTYSLYGAY
jgi:hypothetical protein